MGIFEKLFSKKQEEKTDRPAGEVLKQKKQELWKQAEKKFDSKAVDEAVNHALKMVSALENASGKKDIYKELVAMTNSTRNNICIIVRKELQSIKTGSVKEFYVTAKPALEAIGNADSKYSEITSVAFKNEYSELWDSLKKIHSYFNRIESLAGEEIAKEEKLELMEKSFENAKVSREKISKLEEENSMLSDELLEKKKLLEAVASDFSDYQITGEFAQYSKADSLINDSAKEIESAKNDFSRFIETIYAPLYYYRNHVSSLSDQKIIDRIIEEKGEFMNSENARSTVSKIIYDLKRGVESGSVEINEKRKEKCIGILSQGAKPIFEKFESSKHSLSRNQAFLKSLPAVEKLAYFETRKEMIGGEISFIERKISDNSNSIISLKSRFERDSKKSDELKNSV